MTNWPEYNEALRRRRDLTVWLEAGAADAWRAPKRGGGGGQPKYSDFAIEGIAKLFDVGCKLPFGPSQAIISAV